MAWRDLWRPASFRGVRFRVDASATTGGRRGQTFEHPKRDTPSDEDLGRRAKRWSVSGWVIGPDYNYEADALEMALNAEGHGLLIHPLMGEMMVRCDTYNRLERRTEGGMATFDMIFVEAGQSMSSLIVEATDQTVLDRAEQTRTEAVRSFDNETISV